MGDVVACAACGDEGGGGVTGEETRKGVSRDVRGDGRVGCDLAAALPAVGVSLESVSRGAMQPRGLGLVDVKRHCAIGFASNILKEVRLATRAYSLPNGNGETVQKGEMRLNVPANVRTG